MNRRSIPYTNYSYPQSWAYSGPGLPYYGYRSPPTVRRNSLPPTLEKQPSKEQTSSGESASQRKCLIYAVIILAILLIIAIIALVVLVILYQEKAETGGTASTNGTTTTADSSAPTTDTTMTTTTTTATTTTTTPTTTATTIPPPTVIGFNVTHIKLAYEEQMAVQYSASFNNTEYSFCDMITRDWLGNKYKDICECIKFVSGSVIATVHLTFENSLGKPDDLLNEMKSVIPTKSNTDTRTNKVDADDIMIV